MQKKINIMIATIFLVSMALIMTYKRYNEGITWNYEGQAVVLVDDSSYKFIGLTDVVLNGKVYGFGKYFLGDAKISLVEDQHTYCQDDNCYGLKTMYRYHLDKEGDAYVNKNKWIVDHIIPATVLGNEMPGRKMIRMDWYEWVPKKRTGGEDEIIYKSFVTGYMYFKKAGEMPFAFKLSFLRKDMQEEYKYCIIVPGVSTREEALSVLEKNFDGLIWKNVEEE